MKNIIFFILAAIVISFPLFAQTENVKRLEEEKVYQRLYERDITGLVESLKKKNHSDSIDLLTKILEKVKMKQYDKLQSFFPQKVDGFSKANRSESLHLSDFGEASYGVLYTQKYINKKGNSLEINIVQSDESIKDYQDLIRNPNLIHGMKNTRIVKNNNYKAIETISDDSLHQEQNIILSNELMMTLVAIGTADSDILSNFIANTKMIELKEFLEN